MEIISAIVLIIAFGALILCCGYHCTALRILRARLNRKPLAGKTIVFLGDSILGLVRNATSIASYTARETHAAVYNGGFGGCRMSVHPEVGYAAFCMWTLAQAISENNWVIQNTQATAGEDYFSENVKMLQSIDFQKVDIVVIHYGTNDFTAENPGIPLDNTEDSYDCTTLCGALRYSVEKLSSKFPNLQICVSLPAYRYWPDSNEYSETRTNCFGYRLSDYVDAIRSTAASYNLFVIDSYSAAEINRQNIDSMTYDGVHHNWAGRRRLGKYIGRALNAQFTN